MPNNQKNEEEALIIAVIFFILWIGALFGWAFTNNLPRVGYFYVASEASHGKYSSAYVIRMSDGGGSATNITQQMTLPEAEELCNKLNKDLSASGQIDR